MKRILLLTLLSALLVACDTVKAPEGAQRDPLDPKDYPQVVALDRLGRWLVNNPPIIKGGEADQPMTVTVPVRLTSDENVNAQYRFLFFDAAGAPLRPEMEWRYVLLPGRTEVFLTGTALDKRAADWRCEVRYAR